MYFSGLSYADKTRHPLMKTNNETDDSFSTFFGREITLFKIYIKSKVKNVL